MWFRLLNILFGLVLMIVPALFDYREAAATNNQVIGPLVIAFAMIAIWETTRELRRMNTIFGAWLLVAPWMLGYGTNATITSLVIGAAVIAVSLVKGKVTSQFGGGWTALIDPSKSNTNRTRTGHELEIEGTNH